MRKAYLTILILILFVAGGLLVIRYLVNHENNTTRLTKIGVILNGNREDKSYVQSYYDAMRAYEQSHDAIVTYHDNVAQDAFIALAEDMIADGYWIFVCSSYEYDEEIMEIAAKYPDVYFINGSGTMHAPNYCSFLGRAYQSRYLSGIVAGKRTATGEIGYVIGMPIPETIRQLNAFTLGVRKVNPSATVYVRFTNEWNDDEIARQTTADLLDAHDIDVLSLHINTISPLAEADRRGVYIIGNNYDNRELFPDTYLTACVFHWEDFLTARIEECEHNRFRGMHYWESLRSGVVELAPLTGNIYFATGEEVERERVRLQDGNFDVFYGPIRDNSGVLRVLEGENIPDTVLLSEMYWFVDGVVTE